MYRKDLQRLLGGDYLPNFFALYGADNFQIELFANSIKDKFKSDEILSVYFDEYDYETVHSYISHSSLFSDKKILEIKTSKKLPKKDIENLIKICKQDKDKLFLLELYDEASKQTELEKIFENNFARFFKPANAKEAVELLSLKAKIENIKATQNALYLLYENFDENLYLCAAELNKFKNLSIDENTVKEHCFSLSVSSFDSFFEKMLQDKDLASDLEKIIENFNEIALISALNSNFYRLFKIVLYAKINGKVDFKDIFGYTPPPQVANTLQNQAFMIRLSQYKEVFFLLLNSEYELKTKAKLSKKEFVIAMFLNLKKILKA